MNTPRVSLRGLRVAVFSAELGNVLLALWAFLLSFSALRDLARRSGIDPNLDWLWPLIVDGIIVVATVSVFALEGTRVVWYPWLLLILGTGVSVAANALHAVVAAEATVPAVLAAAVASVPPIVLVASTHLTALLIRHSRAAYSAAVEARQAAPASPESHSSASDPTIEIDLEPPSDAPTQPEHLPLRMTPTSPRTKPDPRRLKAIQLRAEGVTNNAEIGRQLGVDRSTVGRWIALEQPQEQEVRS